jgi:hypothetical protein
MPLNAKTPLALYKANLELVLRLGTLLQENRRRWTQLGASNTREAIERTLAETERVLTSNDWTSLAAMPGEEFWKSLREDAAPLQASVETALGNQAAFAEGLQEAFEAWRQQSVDALGSTGMQLPDVPFADFLKGFPVAAKSPGSAPRETPTAAAKARPRAKPQAKPKAKAKAKAATKKTSAGKKATRTRK